MEHYFLPAVKLYIGSIAFFIVLVITISPISFFLYYIIRDSIKAKKLVLYNDDLAPIFGLLFMFVGVSFFVISIFYTDKAEAEILWKNRKKGDLTKYLDYLVYGPHGKYSSEAAVERTALLSQLGYDVKLEEQYPQIEKELHLFSYGQILDSLIKSELKNVNLTLVVKGTALSQNYATQQGFYTKSRGTLYTGAKYEGKLTILDIENKKIIKEENFLFIKPPLSHITLNSADNGPNKPIKAPFAELRDTVIKFVLIRIKESKLKE